jgi:hypothetical protein
MDKVIVKPAYVSIESVREICEPWIELWGGDEWGDVMRALHMASTTDYGFSDEDCALFTSKLIENLIIMKINWRDLGEDLWGYGYSPEDGKKAVAETRRKCRVIRDTWLDGDTFNFPERNKIVKETLDSLPKWLFEEE